MKKNCVTAYTQAHRHTVVAARVAPPFVAPISERTRVYGIIACGARASKVACARTCTPFWRFRGERGTRTRSGEGGEGEILKWKGALAAVCARTRKRAGKVERGDGGDDERSACLVRGCVERAGLCDIDIGRKSYGFSRKAGGSVGREIHWMRFCGDPRFNKFAANS